MSERWRVRGIRGAITVPRNDAQDIIDATYELVTEIMNQRGRSEEIASAIFTVTPDSTPPSGGRGTESRARSFHPYVPRKSRFPVDRPLRAGLDACEYDQVAAEIQHVYLGAAALRPDCVRVRPATERRKHW